MEFRAIRPSVRECETTLPLAHVRRRLFQGVVDLLKKGGMQE
ncbi:MAG: hypothetical protein OXC26_08170 [Albidovulum sp.]|nr:hypothetical protein [Albidovulum sp.]